MGIVGNVTNTTVKKLATHSPQRQPISVQLSAEEVDSKESTTETKTVPNEKSVELNTTTIEAKINQGKQPDKKETDVDKETLKQLAGKMNDAAGLLDRKITYEIDDQTDKLIVRVVDKETGEVIRQIPPDELLTLAANLEEMKGVVLSETG